MKAVMKSRRGSIHFLSDLSFIIKPSFLSMSSLRYDAPSFVPSFLQEVAPSFHSQPKKQSARNGNRKRGDKKGPVEIVSFAYLPALETEKSRGRRQKGQGKRSKSWRKGNKYRGSEERGDKVVTGCQNPEQQTTQQPSFEERFPLLKLSDVAHKASTQTTWGKEPLKLESVKAPPQPEDEADEKGEDPLASLSLLSNVRKTSDDGRRSNENPISSSQSDVKETESGQRCQAGVCSIRQSRSRVVSKLRERWFDIMQHYRPQPMHQTSESEEAQVEFAVVSQMENVSDFRITAISTDQSYSTAMKTVDSAYENSRDPLSEAIESDDTEAIAILVTEIDRGIREPVFNDAEMWALQLATHLNRPRALKSLLFCRRKDSLTRKENPNHPPAVLIAAEFAYEECLQYLISSDDRYPLAARDSTGNNVLHISCREQVPVSILETIVGAMGRATCKLLLSFNNNQQNPVHIACLYQRTDAIDLMLSHLNVSALSKALTATDTHARTPLLTAIDVGALDIVMSLLMWRGNNHVELLGTPKDCPVVRAVKTQNAEMVELLLEFNNPIEGGYRLDEALLEAVISDNIASFLIVRLLLTAGANPYRPVDGNGSAFERAVELHNQGMIQSLVSTYDSILLKAQSSRRRDPVLVRQPQSFFLGMESRENYERTVAIRNGLVRLLCSCIPTNYQRRETALSCALALYDIGASLGHIGVADLLNTIRTGEKKQIFSEDCYYRTSWCLEARLPRSKVRDFSWSQVLMYQNFCLKNTGCKWWDEDISQPNEQTETRPTDFVLFSEDGREFHVHSDLVCAKSDKMKANFHFMSVSNSCSPMNGQMHLPARMCLWILHHMYHGSLPNDVWSCPKTQFRANLLELLLAGEELLCSSLVAECEARLLLPVSKQSCFCSHCCPGDEFTKLRFCPDTTHPSSLLSPDAALDILIVAQHVGDIVRHSNEGEIGLVFHSDYTSAGLQNGQSDEAKEYSNCLGTQMQPLDCVRMLAAQTVLDSFSEIDMLPIANRSAVVEEVNTNNLRKKVIEWCLCEIQRSSLFAQIAGLRTPRSQARILVPPHVPIIPRQTPNHLLP